MSNQIKLKIVFMGTSSFAATILEALFRNEYNIISVFTQPDKKTGRSQEIQKSAVKKIAEEKKITLFQPEKFDEKTIGELKKQKPDIIIVAAYGKILPKEVLNIPGFGCLNTHASLLPKFRGPSPIQNAILEGKEETGTTIMLMNDGIDTGDILSQEKISVEKDALYPELLDKIANASAELLIKTLPDVAKRKIAKKKQAEEEATYCQIIERQDGKIIWSESATTIYNKYRAFYSWPGIFTFLEKGNYNLRLKLKKISLPEERGEGSFKAGEVFEENGKVLVQTGDGSIILDKIQLEGKAETSPSDFKNGFPDFIGSVLK